MDTVNLASVVNVYNYTPNQTLTNSKFFVNKKKCLVNHPTLRLGNTSLSPTEIQCTSDSGTRKPFLQS